jgi:NAD(P)H-dependent flavin oxidoreductase YrpB (nitropropane dioxygenase family)
LEGTRSHCRESKKVSLHTRICDILDIEYPIVLAGMGGVAVPRLVAAVSNAGGLGVLGGAAASPGQLREWIAEVRSLTDRPFGVDTLLPASVRRGAYEKSGPSPMERLPEYQKFAQEFMAREGLEKASPEAVAREAGLDTRRRDGPPPLTREFFEAQLEVLIDERIPVYAAGLGNPGPWVDRFHAQGTTVLAVVGAVRHARQVAESGVDIIVAQGHDGGGHNSPIGAMALIPQVVDAVGDIPVLGAGGITDGRGVAAALMLGAEGVWMGTAFLATDEAALLPFQKEAVLEGNEEGTTISRSITGKPARLIRSKWTQAWEETELEPLPMPFQPMVAMPVLAAASAAGRKDIAPGSAGQGMGMIQTIRPAAEVLESIATGAERALREARRFA